MPTFTDALGRSLEVPRPPRRIVSLVPSLTEALFAFGAGERVVAVTRFCVEPRKGVAAKVRVGGTKNPDLDAIRELRPDLVVANMEENRREDIERLIGEGVPVYVTYPRTVAGAVEMLGGLADLTGSREAARPMVEAAAEALAEARAARGRRRPPRTFCPIWRNPWMTIGPDTYVHDFIACCGGSNVFGDATERYPKIELAEMARRRPEVILLPDEPYRFGPKHLPELSALGHVPAVRDGRIYLLEGKHLTWYGPRIAASLRFVRGLLWAGGAL